jgi:uncharacterized protein DUF2188
MSNSIDGIHTTTNPKGTGWVNQSNGVVMSSHKTKVAAVATGRLVAKRHGAQFTVHRKDGTVIQTRSYAVSPL